MKKKAKKNSQAQLTKTSIFEIRRFKINEIESKTPLTFEFINSQIITPLELPEFFINKTEYETNPTIISICKSQKYVICGSEIGSLYIFDIITYKLKAILVDSYFLSCENCADTKCLLHTSKHVLNKTCTMSPLLYVKIDDNENLYAVNKQGNIYVYNLNNI